MTKRRAPQNYKEFIDEMDKKNSSHQPSSNEKNECDKETIDKLVLKINNNYERTYFDKNNLCTINPDFCDDPNKFVSNLPTHNNKKYIFKTKPNTSPIEKPEEKPVEKPTVPRGYSACISYSSCLTDLIKEQAEKMKNNRHSCLTPERTPRKKWDQKRDQHKDSKPVSPVIEKPKTKVNIDVEIKDIAGLLKLIKDYPLDETIEYNINMDGLHKINSSLTDLNNMIGMKELKENVVDQILYFIQDLHKNGDGDFMHTVIYGPPGTGKTEMAKIIGQIFSKLGILKKGTFRKVTRSDLIAGYLGQTAIKTRDVINDCLGGVLFIDEAYALGNPEKKDSFSKECIDTLCEALSNYKEDLMVIIAGYESELKECFFNYNQGLDSRFTWRFKTDEYKGEELYNIFLKKVSDAKWCIDSETDLKITAAWFEKNLDYFKFFGRDIETLLAKTKIVHGRRVFCKPVEEKRKLTMKDLEKGFELYLKNDEVKKRKENESMRNIIKTMYV
jgi:chromosomal replication initiation ATPase DnaA